MKVDARGKRGTYAKSAARRQEILAAAVDVFSASGFHKGSLRDVAERAGLTQTGVLHHFPSKDHLLKAVLEWRDSEAHAFIPDGIAALDTIRALANLVEHSQNVTPELAELYAVLAAEATAADHPVHEYFTLRYTRVVTSVRDALVALDDAGQLRPDVQPASAARSTIALIDGLQLQWLYDREIDMAAELRRYLQSLIAVDL